MKLIVMLQEYEYGELADPVVEAEFDSLEEMRQHYFDPDLGERQLLMIRNKKKTIIFEMHRVEQHFMGELSGVRATVLCWKSDKVDYEIEGNTIWDIPATVELPPGMVIWRKKVGGDWEDVLVPVDEAKEQEAFEQQREAEWRAAHPVPPGAMMGTMVAMPWTFLPQRSHALWKKTAR